MTIRFTDFRSTVHCLLATLNMRSFFEKVYWHVVWYDRINCLLGTLESRVFFDKMSITFINVRLTNLYKYVFSRIFSMQSLMEGLIPLIYKAMIKRKKSKHKYRCLSRSNSSGDNYMSAPPTEDHQPNGLEMTRFTHMFMTPPSKKLLSFGELGCYTRHSSMREFNHDGLLLEPVAERPHVGRQVPMNKFSKVRSLRIACIRGWACNDLDRASKFCVKLLVAIRDLAVQRHMINEQLSNISYLSVTNRWH